MGNDDLTPLPPKPEAPIDVCERYDNFFREKLLQTIREDVERYPEGKPLYHKYLIRCVSKYASDKVNVESLSLKNFYNFLGGMNSVSAAIAVMDAYIQIARPEKRKTFSVGGYIKNFGDTLSEYLEIASLDGYDREQVLQDLIGMYRLVDGSYLGAGGRRSSDRYFVVRRSNSNRYLLCYQFDLSLNTRSEGEPRDKSFRLWTGIVIPRINEAILLMRNFRYRRPYLGKIVDFRGTKKQISGSVINGSFTMAQLEINDNIDTLSRSTDVHSVESKYGFSRHIWEGIDDRILIKRLNTVVDSFDGVF